MHVADRCDRCRFWISLWSLKRKAEEGDGQGAERRSKRGQCHRRAPQASALTVFWPTTHCDDRCGDFEPWPDERRQL
jgi:hypothetical protein